MRILYAVQATGNGHISRAQELLPHFGAIAEVDVLLSGYQGNLSIGTPVRHRYRGMSFIFGKNGGIDYLRSFQKMRWRRLLRDIRCLDLSDYDLVLSDYEPVAAWAAKKQRVPSISLSHQIALISEHSPKPPSSSPLFNAGIKYMAPCAENIGFHFRSYEDYILPPIIRRPIRDLEVCDQGHICVYLPAYHAEKIEKLARHFPGREWWIFDKHSPSYTKKGNIHVHPISGELWMKKLASSHAVLMGAGFEGPSEALYLGKKLLAIPMRGQPEQHHNAAALRQLGVPVANSLSTKEKAIFESWLSGSLALPVGQVCEPEQVVTKVLHLHSQLLGGQRQHEQRREEVLAS